jgi:hypothetical protein
MKTLLLLSFLITGTYSLGQSTSILKARVGAVSDTVRTTRSILSNPQLVIVNEEGMISKRYTVRRFTLIIFNREGELAYELQGDGYQLTAEHQRRIKSMPPQSTLLFEDIIGTCPDCRNFRLPDIRITIQ